MAVLRKPNRLTLSEIAATETCSVRLSILKGPLAISASARAFHAAGFSLMKHRPRLHPHLQSFIFYERLCGRAAALPRSRRVAAISAVVRDFNERVLPMAEE